MGLAIGAAVLIPLLGAVVLAFRNRCKLNVHNKKFARSYRTNKAWRS